LADKAYWKHPPHPISWGKESNTPHNVGRNLRKGFKMARRGGKRKGAGAPPNFYLSKKVDAVEKLCSKLRTTVEDALEVVALAALKESDELERLYVSDDPKDWGGRGEIRVMAKIGVEEYKARVLGPVWLGGKAVNELDPETVMIAKEEAAGETSQEPEDKCSEASFEHPRRDGAVFRLARATTTLRKAVWSSRKYTQDQREFAVPDLSAQLAKRVCICDTIAEPHFHCEVLHCGRLVKPGQFQVYAPTNGCEVGDSLATVPTDHDLEVLFCRKCGDAANGGTELRGDKTLRLEALGSSRVKVRLRE
jgi:hypothetical protein